MNRFPTALRPTLYIQTSGDPFYAGLDFDDPNFPILRLCGYNELATVELIRNTTDGPRVEIWTAMEAARFFGFGVKLLEVDCSYGIESLRDALRRVAHFFVHLMCPAPNPQTGLGSIDCKLRDVWPERKYTPDKLFKYAFVARRTMGMSVLGVLKAGYAFEVVNERPFQIYVSAVLFDQEMRTTILFGDEPVRRGETKLLPEGLDATGEPRRIDFEREAGLLQWVRFIVSPRPIGAEGFVYESWMRTGKAPSPVWDSKTIGIDLKCLCSSRSSWNVGAEHDDIDIATYITAASGLALPSSTRFTLALPALIIEAMAPLRRIPASTVAAFAPTIALFTTFQLAIWGSVYLQNMQHPCVSSSPYLIPNF
ncbi:hypothetical protein K488DRAFT_84917 [Vararia minispora EC-137]|uniref:Uncharacterized protein n=1 Tax=Vararia minispora EC-137 TaxID=1314806 RepID=A0ACB8QNP1_9AGAM|nr:hypothetical protein K488DRAFT_84917 [Vararia minispora EC-137]